MPGTSSTNSFRLVDERRDKQGDDHGQHRHRPEECQERADVPGDAAALRAGGHGGQRDRDDDREQNRQQQRHELSEQKPDQQQPAARRTAR